jgi:hypothetical protein
MRPDTRPESSKSFVRAAIIVAASLCASTSYGTESGAISALAARPLEFVQNQGQFAADIRFVVDGGPLRAAVTASGIRVALGGSSLELRFDGAQQDISIEGHEPSPTARHWRVGPQQRWRSAVPAYRALTLRDVYPGIDVRVRGCGAALEYDFVVAPGADARQIAVSIEGADAITIPSPDTIEAHTAYGTLVQRIPATWAETADGSRRPLACTPRLIDARRVGFDVAPRAAHETLIIDPVLTASQLLCGNGADEVRSVAVGSDGSVFVAGITRSASFPITASAWDGTFGGIEDAFAAKLSPDLAQIVWCTYLGADGKDGAYGIAVNGRDEPCVVGRIGAATATAAGSWVAWPGIGTRLVEGSGDAFAVHLFDDGETLFFGGLLYGDGDERATSVTFVSDDVFAVCGRTDSSSFLDIAPAWGEDDAFVIRVDESNAAVLPPTRVIGGPDDDKALGVAARAGKLYVCGTTASAPMASRAMPSGPVGFDVTHNGGDDAFVMAMDSALAVTWFSYVGGSGADEGVGLAIDVAHHVHLTGETDSIDFPHTNGAYVAPSAGGLDAYYVRIDGDGAQLALAARLGGTDAEHVGGIALDGAGLPWIVGQTESANFPVSSNAWSKSRLGASDLFAARLRKDGAALEWSTYFGGHGDEEGNAIASAAANAVVLGGRTTSIDYPRTVEGTPQYLENGASGCVTHLTAPDCATIKSSAKYGVGSKGWQKAAPTLDVDKVAYGLTVSGVEPKNAAVLFVGTQQASTPYSGGTLLVGSPTAIVLGTLSTTKTTIAFQPPKYGAITCGLTLYFQVALDRMPSTSTLALTNGVRVTFGQ